MPRLFIAISLSSELQRPIDRLCQGLPGVQWQQPHNRHLTLRFLGSIDSRQFGEIGESLTRVRSDPVDINLRGLGHFPKNGEIRSLYVGIDHDDALTTLRRAINRVLKDYHIEHDPRPFVPHITIGRVRSQPPIERMISYLKRRSLFSTEPVIVSDFCLYSSHLDPAGSEYRIEARYDFVRGLFDQF